MRDSRSEPSGLCCAVIAFLFLVCVAVFRARILGLFTVFQLHSGVRPSATAINSPPARDRSSEFASPLRPLIPSARAHAMFRTALSRPPDFPGPLARASPASACLRGTDLHEGFA